MYDEDIEKIDEWFRQKEAENSFGTYHHTMENDGEEGYSVGMHDIEEFCDFLRESILDLIGFSTMISNDGIWFHREDLERASFY